MYARACSSHCHSTGHIGYQKCYNHQQISGYEKTARDTSKIDGNHKECNTSYITEATQGPH